FEVTMVKRHDGQDNSTAASRTARAWQFDWRRPEKQGLRQPPRCATPFFAGLRRKPHESALVGSGRVVPKDYLLAA
ncbi:MAG: hypothetical protein ACRD3T_18510, partial [Terriglobia bacterium]